jgi:hypothetical protein
MNHAALLMGIALLPSAPPASTQGEFFERRVRPVLLEHCARCHGERKQMSGLRLDTRAGFLKGGDNGPVVKPGDPDGSRLVQAVRHQGELKMPPRQQLPPEVVSTLSDWVRAGATWPAPLSGVAGTDPTKHWAFQPVRPVLVPGVRAAREAHSPVDPFILAKLEAKGLTLSPPAEPRALIRRLHIDLLGLPPTPEEVEAFVADPSPDAYERLVDRLLASPHHGERWGRHWLDLARFADTKGYVFFEESVYPWAWTYRDYVLSSFNHDKPYDRFLLEQLAADKLDLGADRTALTALGFITLGGKFMNNVHDILDDRIDVVSRGLLGLTVSCARCHDHKFDPVSQADYYALYGVFASCAEPTIPPLFQPPPTTTQYTSFVTELQKREKALADFVKAKQAAVFQGARTRVAEYLLAAHARRGQPSADDFMLLADGTDINPAMLKRWQAYLERAGRTHHPVWAPWHAFAAVPEKEFTTRSAPLMLALRAGRCADQRVNPLVARALVEMPPRSMNEVAARYAAVLLQTEKLWQKAPDALADPHREQLRRVVHGPEAPPDVPPGQINDLDLLPDRPAQDQLQKLLKAVEQWRISGPGAPPRAHALIDLPVPYQPRIFRRGNPHNPGEAVPRRFPRILGGQKQGDFKDGSGRLELARAIADPANPLTARVLVNRLWQHHFGEGIVRTPSDFGLRCEPPTHPELLDWLAAEFVRGGWSVKKLHRLIVLSAVYRQTSAPRPDGLRLDPENTLLWRMNRRRLDFESTRDAVVAVAGRLEHRLGGPSTKDILSPTSTRRTLYGWVDRLHVPELYRSFDFPAPDATSARRERTTVPQQALFLMNNPFLLTSARQLVSRPDVVCHKEIGPRIQRMYQLCYGRDPTGEEEALAREFLAEGRPEQWTRYAQALLLANEFVFVD